MDPPPREVGMTMSGWRLMAAMIAATMAAEGTAGAVVLCKKKNGAAFVRDACKKKETQVPAAELGLVGPPGANGTNGTNGAPGAVGPSHTYQTVGTDVPFTTSSVTVATLSLPAGKYLVMGRTWVTNDAGDNAECDLVASADGSETGTFTKDSMKVSSGTSDDTPAMTTLVHEFTSAGVVKAHCVGQFDGGTAHRPTITAIEVGAIN
jgi:hypothetical protein